MINLCPIHKAKYGLSECNAFKKKSFSDGKHFVKDRRLCFECLKPNHRVIECPNTVACSKCNSDGQMGVVHSDSFGTSRREKGEETTQRNSMNNENRPVGPPQVTSRFTMTTTSHKQIYNDVHYKSCAKIVLVNVC
ncbi:hypothetical protein DPMN_161712 [Dreissena polymorpha]|uniref:CCHC-type domain-containing protein n=1 Tax=Dreissena polymorpha TaxID=45954 RepID=A0A9D4EQE0_DREPO|nr:hypothetical protein DPMN_161712 [Dreissena polymorpha]